MSEAFWMAMLSNAVIAALLGGVGWLLTVRRPAVAHALFALALLKLVTPPLFAVPVPAPFAEIWSRTEPARREGRLTFEQASPQRLAAEPKDARADAAAAIPTSSGDRATTTAGAAADPASAADTPAPAATWRPEHAGLLGWAAGSLVVALVLMRRARRLRQLVTQAHPADAATIAEVTRARAATGLRRLPQVRIVRAAIPPHDRTGAAAPGAARSRGNAEADADDGAPVDLHPRTRPHRAQGRLAALARSYGLRVAVVAPAAMAAAARPARCRRNGRATRGQPARPRLPNAAATAMRCSRMPHAKPPPSPA